jgi:hypothetical protein
LSTILASLEQMAQQTTLTSNPPAGQTGRLRWLTDSMLGPDRIAAFIISPNKKSPDLLRPGIIQKSPNLLWFRDLPSPELFLAGYMLRQVFWLLAQAYFRRLPIFFQR